MQLDAQNLRLQPPACLEPPSSSACRPAWPLLFKILLAGSPASLVRNLGPLLAPRHIRRHCIVWDAHRRPTFGCMLVLRQDLSGVSSRADIGLPRVAQFELVKLADQLKCSRQPGHFWAPFARLAAPKVTKGPKSFDRPAGVLVKSILEK